MSHVARVLFAVLAHPLRTEFDVFYFFCHVAHRHATAPLHSAAAAFECTTHQAPKQIIVSTVHSILHHHVKIHCTRAAQDQTQGRCFLVHEHRVLRQREHTWPISYRHEHDEDQMPILYFAAQIETNGVGYTCQKWIHESLESLQNLHGRRKNGPTRIHEKEESRVGSETT